MTQKDMRERFVAVQKIFSESSSTVGKLQSVQRLLTGIHPEIDKKLEPYKQHLSALQHLEEGAYVQLSAETLPENTEQEKKRKAALLLFLKSLRDLKDETARVQSEMETAQQSNASDSSLWMNIFKSAKGPLGLITILAVGAALLHTTAVEIEIKNNGCSPIQSSGGLPFPIPGLSLPEGAIADGESGIAKVPPLTFDVEGGAGGTLYLSALGFNMTFELANVDDITLNGESLLEGKTNINLGDAKKHSLEILCR